MNTGTLLFSCVIFWMQQLFKLQTVYSHRYRHSVIFNSYFLEDTTVIVSLLHIVVRQSRPYISGRRFQRTVIYLFSTYLLTIIFLIVTTVANR